MWLEQVPDSEVLEEASKMLLESSIWLIFHNAPLPAPSPFLYLGSLPQPSSCLLGTSKLLFKYQNSVPLLPPPRRLPASPQAGWDDNSSCSLLGHSIPHQESWLGMKVTEGPPSHGRPPHQSPALPLSNHVTLASNFTSLILPCSICKMGLIMLLAS